MQTDCKETQLEFQGLGRRRVIARFDGGRISSDGGLLLLHEVAERTGLLKRFAQCFTDHRDPAHDALRDDTLLALAVGKSDLTGAERTRERDRGHALAGKSTLNRLERTPEGAGVGDRYKKIVYDGTAIEALFGDAFIQAHARAPEEIVLDLDATDDPLHGHQEGRFFHGYYGCYCYLPLYIFCGDSGFAREELMSWCEQQGVDFIFGLARNSRLEAVISSELAEAEAQYRTSGKPVRIFKDFTYQTLDSWSQSRRVVGKAEHLPDKPNPRFVVTSYPIARLTAAPLYEKLYCARGDMENRIKEQQLGLFADRTSTATMRANQLRLWFAAVAYVLVNELRRTGLRGTELARAQVSTIRCRLLKIGAGVTVSVRRIVAALSSAFPLRPVFAHVLANLQRAYPLRI